LQKLKHNIVVFRKTPFFAENFGKSQKIAKMTMPLGDRHGRGGWEEQMEEQNLQIWYVNLMHSLDHVTGVSFANYDRLPTVFSKVCHFGLLGCLTVSGVAGFPRFPSFQANLLFPPSDRPCTLHTYTVTSTCKKIVFVLKEKNCFLAFIQNIRGQERIKTLRKKRSTSFFF
jgi:hypothetical protein